MNGEVIRQASELNYITVLHRNLLITSAPGPIFDKVETFDIKSLDGRAFRLCLTFTDQGHFLLKPNPTFINLQRRVCLP